MNHFDFIQSEFNKIAKKPMRKRTVEKQKQKAKEMGNFLKEQGQQLVNNPSPKAKKKQVLISSLLHGDQAQKSLFQRLYKAWKSTGGISSVTRDIKRKEKEKAKDIKHKTKLESERMKSIKSLQEAAEEKKKRQEAERKQYELEERLSKFEKDRGRIEEKKEEMTEKPASEGQEKRPEKWWRQRHRELDDKIESSPIVKKVEQLAQEEDKIDKKIEENVEKQTEKLEETGNKNDNTYQQKIETINKNKEKLQNNVDMFKDPPPPQQRNEERYKRQLSQMNEALQSLGVKDFFKQVNIVDSPNFNTVQFKVTSSDYKAKHLDAFVSDKTSDVIGSFIKSEGVGLFKNKDETKDYDFSIQIPKGFTIDKRDIVSFKELITSDEFLNEREKHPGDLIVPIGRDPDNKVQTINASKDNNIVIIGGIGSGKTVNLHDYINAIQSAYSPEEQQLVIIDPKNVELKRYKDSKYLALPVVAGGRSDAEFLQKVHDTFDHLGAEHLKRKDFLGNVQELTGKSFDNIADWNEFIKKARTNKLDDKEKVILDKIPQEQQKLIPRINVAIDELLSLIQKDAIYTKSVKGARSIVDHIVPLLAESRATGIGCIACTQSFKAELIPGRLHGLFKGKLVGRVPDRKESAELAKEFDMGPHNLLPTGDIMYSGESRGDKPRVQSGRAMPDELDAAAKSVSGDQHFIEQINKKEKEQETKVDPELQKIRDNVKKSMEKFEEIERDSAELKKKYEPIRKQIQNKLDTIAESQAKVEEERAKRKGIEEYEAGRERELKEKFQYKKPSYLETLDEGEEETTVPDEPKVQESKSEETDTDAALQKEIDALTAPVSREDIETKSKSKEDIEADKKIKDAERASEGRVTEDYTKDMEKKRKSIINRLMSLAKRKKAE